MKRLSNLAVVAIFLNPIAITAQPVSYPNTPRIDVVDDYHGTSVTDSYRWLEALDSGEVAEWVAAQNEVSRPYLGRLEGVEELKERLTELWDYERYNVPFTAAGKYYYFHNNGTQDQNVLYVQDEIEGDARVVLDPNTFRADATVSLGGYSISPDGKYFAYGLSDGGTDWRTWHVLDLKTGENLADEIHGSKFSVPVAWTIDEKGFYYSRYPQRDDGTYDDAQQSSIYHHVLGEPQEADDLIYSLTKERFPVAGVTEDGNYLVISLSAGAGSNEVLVKSLMVADSPLTPLFSVADARYGLIGNDGPTFYVRTTKDAPLGRLISVNVDHPEPENWSEMIPESEATLRGVSYVGGRFIAQYLSDAKSLIKMFDKNGVHLEDIELPGIGRAGGFSGRTDAKETFFSFSSYTTPGAVYHYDIEAGEVDLWKQAEPSGFEPDDFIVEQVFYSSKDGTRIPMFIVHQKGIEKDGNNRTLLYGYGGFNIPMTPSYSPGRMAWLEQGGILAVANLRGGGEYGDEWHDAGKLFNKQNVFDDFIAAAEYLIEQRYTSSKNLAVQGGSNGGLLVGAVITQRPDLFGAALPAVGVLDMLRYHTASANARQWSADYGLSEDPEMFKAQLAYSPNHNVHEGTCYPPTLITTADHDDRVVPWHSFKFAAELQHAQGCDNPILLRVETRAGHGAGTPTWMRIERTADLWAFLLNELSP